MALSFGSKLYLTFVLSVICVSFLGNVQGLKNVGRIVGGVATSIARNKYMVNLRSDGIFICGGAILSARHVVTAAHCVVNKNPKTIIVHGGETYLNGTNGLRRAVDKIFIPSLFTMKGLNWDVALIKLVNPMNGANMKPIKMCTQSMPMGVLAKVTGWGLTKEGNANGPNRLREVRIKMIAKQRCEALYGTLSGTMICALGPSGKDSCSGDSGGPLVYGGKLCGLVSWGTICGAPNAPGVYTAINVVRRFIIRNMLK